MRVAFVGQSGESIGGAERSMQLLVSHLPDDVEPVAVLFEDGAYASELRERGIAVEIVPLGREVMAVQRERLPLSAALGTLGMIPRLAAAYRRIAPRVVYTNTVKAHVLGNLAARLAGRPSILHLRDILEGRARDVLRAVGATASDRRIAISRAVSRALALPKTTVIPNPLDLGAYAALPGRAAARAELGLPANVPLVGLIGRINRWKGHDRFVRIAARLAETSDAHFAIVGEPVFRDADFAGELRAQVAALGLGERFHFVPWLADPRPAYAALDVNVNASRGEPFGRTIIEAAACGVPTVAFDEGGAPEAIAPYRSGLVVPADDEAAFAAAIALLLRPGERPAYLAGSRAHALDFDARLHAARVAEVIREVARA